MWTNVHGDPYSKLVRSNIGYHRPIYRVLDINRVDHYTQILVQDDMSPEKVWINIWSRYNRGSQVGGNGFSKKATS